MLQKVMPPFAGFLERKQIIFIQNASIWEHFGDGHYFGVLSINPNVLLFSVYLRIFVLCPYHIFFILMSTSASGLPQSSLSEIKSQSPKPTQRLPSWWASESGPQVWWISLTPHKWPSTSLWNPSLSCVRWWKPMIRSGTPSTSKSYDTFCTRP